MSFSSSREIALDPGHSIERRMSQARSCAMLVGQKWHVRRSVILEVVRQASGVDLTVAGSDADIELALAVLVDIKANGLPPGAA